MSEKTKRHKKLSPISTMHLIKLIYRSGLFCAAAILYIINRINQTGSLFGGVENSPLILILIWLVFVVEMIFRFFPSKIESMGCQKQFARNFRETNSTPPSPRTDKGVWAIASVWMALNAAIGVLYYTHIIDAGILLLISLAFSVCDMICILFFCPFQTWFMKNKCCTSCRIYNWDYAMMFTPLIFVRNFFALSIFLCALLLLIRWEITAYKHPERFSEQTNASLACQNCQEKLCHHKKQLRRFLQDNKNKLQAKAKSYFE